MREIKFKYWNSVTNIYVDEPRMPFIDGWTITELFSERGWIWLQYTGLKDKNGVEIYEGDILLISDEVIADYIGGHSRYEPENRIEAVEWKNEYSGWFTKSDALCEQTVDSEVIGNIYQNPELLI